MGILADWFRRAMGRDRATLIGRGNAVCGEWKRPTKAEQVGLARDINDMVHRRASEFNSSPIMRAKFDAANERIALAAAMYRGREVPESNYARMCDIRTKGWPQWKINFDLTAHERSLRTARGNRTRYARLRAEVAK